MSNNDDQAALKSIMNQLAKELSLTMSSDEKKEFSESFKTTLVEDIYVLKAAINFYQEEIKRSTEMISAIENDPVNFFDNNGPAGFPVTEEYTAAKEEYTAAKAAMEASIAAMEEAESVLTKAESKFLRNQIEPDRTLN